MKARHYLFAALRGGSARSFLAANLAWLWRQQGEKVLLIETLKPAESELALHLGLEAGSDPAIFGDALLTIACLDKNLDRSRLESLSKSFSRVIVDGACLEEPRAAAWLNWADQIVLVERGDLQGFRRAQLAWQRLALQALSKDQVSVWLSPAMADSTEQELGLQTFKLPFFHLAAQRLAEAAPPIGADPMSPFSKAFSQAAAWLAQQNPRRDAIGPTSTALGMQDLTDQLVDHVRQNLPFNSQEASAQLPGKFREIWGPQVRQMAALRLAEWPTQELGTTAREEILKSVGDWILGLGPLEEPLADERVTEIMVNRRDQIYVEKEGRLSLTDLKFPSDQSLLTVIERIVAPLGRRVDESSPRVDARLPDGSRVNAIIPPLALKGPCLTIRKFPKNRMNAQNLVDRGSLSPEACVVLRQAVEQRQNIVVSGGTGSGKTTLLNALSSFIPEDERIVTIEDSAELKLDQSHVVSLESRPRNLEGRGEVSIRDLVINSLRMRPDRIVVGECRSGEALDMLQAMNTGHDGSLTTVHANSPRDAIARLETLCLMSDVDLPLSALRRQICAAVNLIVQVSRLKDGSRRIMAITELVGLEGEMPLTQDLFVFNQSGEKDGKIIGQLEPCGIPARFYRDAREAGYEMDFSVFQVATPAR